MRTIGTILMIFGANLIVGSIAFAFWVGSFDCAMESTQSCGGRAFELFIDIMGSRDGAIFWMLIVVGLLVFWRGKQMRADN